MCVCVNVWCLVCAACVGLIDKQLTKNKKKKKIDILPHFSILMVKFIIIVSFSVFIESVAAQMAVCPTIQDPGLNPNYSLFFWDEY